MAPSPSAPGTVYETAKLPQLMQNPTVPVTPSASGGGLMSNIGKVVSDMPDWAKYSMASTAAQGVSGMASGYFQGASAEEQLAQQQVLADREQRQRELLNKQGSYAPLITFRDGGLAQQGTA